MAPCARGNMNERNWGVLLAGVLCGVIAGSVYLNTLDCGIVFDDEPAIKKNEDLRPKTPWVDLLKHDFWGAVMSSKTSHKSYRPLCVASFKLNYLLHELQPMGYHLVNVLLHSAVCYLYVQLCGVVFSEVWPALIAGLLFAVHPIHTEAVAGLVGRTELLSGFFFLAALLSYHRASYHKAILKSSQSLFWMSLTVVFGLCSALSKEQGITVMAVCIFYDFFVVQKMSFSLSVDLLKSLIKAPRSAPGWFVQFMKRTLVLAVFAIGFLVFRVRLMEGRPDIFNASINPPMFMDTPHRQLSWLHLIFVNAQLLFNPSHLCADWRFGVVPLITSFTDWHNFLTLAAFVVLAVLGIFSVSGNSKQSKMLLFGLVLLAFPFIPASNLFFPVGFVVAERVLYTPSMGFCFIIGYGAWYLHKKAGNLVSRSSIKLFILALLLFHAAKSFHRSHDWKSNVTLYGSGVRCNPNNGVMLTNLGIEHGRLKNFTFAERLYRRSTIVAPEHSRGFSNLGGLLEALKRYDESEKAFRRAIELGMKDNTGGKVVETVAFLIEKVIMRNASRYADALTLCNEMLEAYPTYAQLYSLQGCILFKMNHVTEALDSLELAAQSQLMLPQTYYYLGMAYSSLGDKEKAQHSFETAMQLDPSFEDTPYQLGRVLYLSGVQGKRLVDVEKMLLMALKNTPRHGDAAYLLGQVYFDLKNYPKAEEIFKKVRPSRPTDTDVLYYLGRSLYKQRKYAEATSIIKQLLEKSPEHLDATNLLQAIELQIHV